MDKLAKHKTGFSLLNSSNQMFECQIKSNGSWLAYLHRNNLKLFLEQEEREHTPTRENHAAAVLPRQHEALLLPHFTSSAQIQAAGADEDASCCHIFHF